MLLWSLHTKAYLLAKTVYFLSLRQKRREENLIKKQKEGGTERKKGVAADGEKWKAVLLVLGG